MHFRKERVSPTLCRFHVTVDKKQKEAAQRAVVGRLPTAGEVALGPAVMEQLADDCIPDILQQAGILPLTPIRLIPKENSENKECNFSFEVETLPQLDLPADLSSLSVEVEEPLPDPREFKHAVLQAQRSRAVLHTVEEKRLPKDGDVLRLNITVQARGKELFDMRHDDFTMTLSPVQDPLSEVETLARTLYAGEKKQCSVTCPEDYPDASLHNQTLILQVELVSICTEELPPFDEALAVKLGFPTLEKLKHSIFDHIMGEKIRNIQSRAQKRLIDSLLQNKTFPIPSSIMLLNKNDCEQEARSALRRQKKTEEEIRRTLKSMEKELYAQAEDRSRIQVLLLAVAEREHLRVSKEETDRQIRRLAEQNQTDYNALHNAVYKSSLLYDLQLRLLTAKALQLMYTKARKTVVDSNGEPVPAPEVLKS